MLASVATSAGDPVIVKHAQPRRWTTVDRQTINDERLSFRARGVLVWLLDKPEDWQWSSETVASEGLEGREAVRTAVRELEAQGYIIRCKRQLDDGRWVTEVWVYERPEDHSSEDGSAVFGFSQEGESAQESDARSPDAREPATGAQEPVFGGFAEECEHHCGPDGIYDVGPGQAARCPIHPRGRRYAA